MKALTEEQIEREEFIRVFNTLGEDIERFKRLSNSSIFSQTSKKLLSAYHYYIKRKKEKAFETLSLTRPTDPFYQGMKSYILGLCHNQFGNYAFAVEHLDKAYNQLKNYKVDKVTNYCLVLLVVAHYNRNDCQLVNKYWTELKNSKPHSEMMDLSKIQCECLTYMINLEFDKAQKIISKQLDKKDKASTTFKSTFLVMLFICAAAQEQFSYCHKILEKYKKASGFTVKANYKFMKLLLDHISTDSSMYVYKKDFKDSSELFDQLMVIKSLSEGDLNEAKVFWKNLKKHNNKLYTKDFQYNGVKNIFSIALEKYNQTERNIDKEKLIKLSSPLDKLQYIIENSTRAVDKYDLIEMIWEDEINEVSLSRLRKLVTKYRRKTGHKVVSIQNSYVLKRAS